MSEQQHPSAQPGIEKKRAAAALARLPPRQTRGNNPHKQH